VAWFKKEKTPKAAPARERKITIPEGLWVKCDNCKEIVYKKEVARNANVCPKCNYHFRISARERLEVLYDDGKYREFDTDIAPVDALGFVDSKAYASRIATYQAETGLKDALISSEGLLGGLPVIIAVMEYGFMGGSMGSVVGEKVTRAAERAHDARCPLIVVSCSGGARMQEGLLSLMQMAKTNASLTHLAQAGLPYISVLADPTMGGVSASFAFVGDVVIAEPKALIGFAGPRVIENTVREKLPEGFQRAEFLLQTGAIDMIVDRRELRPTIARQIAMLQRLPSDAVA